ncbi:DUF2911 domain-containing protein [Winogradskyella sp. A3E31]|uniref:DUF2911 domain-containing protein n=1 Tax=Winogradskyella sp. A3E31 TaxID=3349637 RepID=UPI00398AB7D9
MKTITQVAFCLMLCLSLTTQAQLNTPRGSQQATVTQRVGTTDISITYSRPSVNDRDIWGSLVPYGLNDFQFGTSKAAPWRAGANENTTISFTHNAKVEGKAIAAGTYGLHFIVNENNTATLILSNDSNAWGSYFYNPANDALRADITTVEVPHHELLTYEFNDVKANSATAQLVWEKKAFPFTIEVDVTDIVLSDIRAGFKGQAGFTRQNWEQAAGYALSNGGDLDEALAWVNNAIEGQFYSQKTFANLQLKAQILSRMNRADEAAAVMDEALPMANVLQVHQYGRTLIANGDKDKALEVFKMNAENNKDTWPVHYGLARGYSAKGDYKTALKHLRKALANAPNDASKGNVQANIDKLEKGEDIN